MQFTGEEWAAFASKLEQATNVGKLKWNGTDSSDNPFDEHPGFSATIQDNATYNLRSRDHDGEFPYVLTISTPSGEEIANFTTVSYGDVWEQNTNAEQSASATLARLYETVTRLVTGAPQKAKSLLDGLDSLITDINDPF